MGDEDRGDELPQRVRDAPRGAPHPPDSPPAPLLSAELRQRLAAAVTAEVAPPRPEVPLDLHHRHELTSAPFLTERAGSPRRWLMNRDAAQRHPGIRGFLVTKTSGGCPGLQAGEESGALRSGAR